MIDELQPNPDNVMNGSLQLPPVLSSKLSEYRRRVWIVKLAEGVLAAIFGLGVSYLIVLGLDRFFETPAWLRGILLTLGAAVPGLGLPLKWHKWVWRQRRLEDAARLLRSVRGLAGLAQRVAVVDGTLTVRSPAGGPTVVTVELPLHA